MKLRRALHLVGAGALTGALLLGTAPTAVADDIRDGQWPLKAFDAKQIWQHSTGKGVVVAVLDTGVDASHPDLKGQVLPGTDVTDEGGDPHTDPVGHGSAMAGLIAGHGHGLGNEDGVMGLAPDAKILPVTVTHEHDSTGNLPLAKGIRYAVDHGADVINMSEVTGRQASDLKAIKYAIDHDVVLVAGTGNLSGKHVNYPAAYPGVVSVGGVDETGSFWDKSSWGSNTTLIAPATNDTVIDPTLDRGYALSEGTSDATALVSASAALVIAAHPDLSAGQVINRLVKTAKIPEGADPNAKLPDPKFGYGIVRPLRAVTYDIPAGPKAGPLAQPSDGTSSESAKASPPADTDQQSASDDQSSSSSNTLVYVLIGLGVLVVLVIVIVLVARKNKGGGNGPQSPGGGSAYTPPMPHQGNQQYQPPTGEFGPPPPNQPPMR